MKTIGSNMQNINTVNSGRKNVDISGSEKNTAELNEIFKRDGESNSIGDQIKAFASKAKMEVKETAGEIKEKAIRVGAGITGRESKELNCSLGFGIGVIGAAANVIPLAILGLTMMAAGTVMIPLLGHAVESSIKAGQDPSEYQAKGENIAFWL